MEFRIFVDELQNIMSRLSNVVRINEEGVTSMVMVEANDGLKFKATDGSVNISINSEQCEIISKGKALFRFKDIKGYIMKFIPLIEDYGTKDFHFTADDEVGIIKTKTHFQSGKPSYRTLKFEVFNTETYPIVKGFEDPQLIVNSNILKRGIARVLHCINPSEVRKAMTGLCVTVEENKIVFVGTNGVKLAEFEMEINADITKKSYIFSYNFASILRNVLDDDAQVFMKFEGSHVYVKSNNVYMIGSLIIGESYPDYRPMFDLESAVRFPRLDFTDSVHSVMDVLDPEDNNRLTLTFEGNTLKLKNDRVEYIQEFDVPFGKSIDIDINGEFLDSILKDFIGAELEIYFREGNNYIVFRSPENSKHTALLTIVKRR
jgi:DNA polymerase III sliding clamp (beta) subunit (PCNA family)